MNNNNLIQKIQNLSGQLVIQMMNNNMSNDEAEDAVLVILKEHLEAGKSSIEDFRECIMTLEMLLGKYD